MLKKTVLKNGLRLVTFPMENTKAVTILLLVGTGSKYETKRVNGISHLLEHMVFKGTKKRSNTTVIARELDRVGGAYNAFTDKEITGFWIKVQSEHLDLALDVLSDMIFNSLFEEHKLEKEKKVIIEEINMIKDVPQNQVFNLWEELLYGDQPAGWMISGEKETVNNISRKDILNYLRNQYVAENVVVALAGNFSEKEIIPKIKKFFGKFKKNKPLPKKPVREIQKFPNLLLEFKETDQTHLCLGVRTFNLFSPRRHSLEVLATVLGGIMSSRLFIKVRENKGLAYYIRTINQFYIDSGYLVTSAGIDNKRILEAIEIILKEYKNLKEKKITKLELETAKAHLKGNLWLGLETSDSWASYFGAQEIFKEKILTPEEKCRQIDKISQGDILKIAQDIFQPEKLNLALIGPFKEKEKFQKILKYDQSKKP